MKRLIRTLLSALLLSTAATLVAPNTALAAEQSYVFANDVTVRSGCNFIPITYGTSANYSTLWGYDDWDLQININGPDGHEGGEYMSGILDDPAMGVFNLQMCDYEGDSIGTYNITWSFETPGLTETGNSSFNIKPKPKPPVKPTAKLSLTGSTVKKTKSNKAVYKVRGTAKVGRTVVAGRTVKIAVARGGSEWVNKGSARLSRNGTLSKKVTWRWGEVRMPKKLLVRTCLTGTSTYKGTCTVKRLNVQQP